MSFAQRPGDIIRGVGDRGRSLGNAAGQSGGTDSFRKRNRFEDSITVSYRYLDSTATYFFDTTINDDTKRFPIPATYIHLGNPGTAARSLLFDARRTIGWDPGFHAFDIYKWSLDRIPFYNTTRPYTELGYTLGSQTQQIIEILHTQNITPNWNAALQYRQINSPGFFKNQKVNHNNYLFSSNYQSRNRRYHNYVGLLANNLQSAENGGIRTDQDYLNDPFYNDRFRVPTKLGGAVGFERDIFSNRMETGNVQKEFNAFVRQQYDLGKKDSLVLDSTVVPLFYPRLRFEHTFNLGKYSYRYKDNTQDTGYYKTYYNGAPLTDTVSLVDKWREITNDFSIYQYPDAKNLHQFIKAGIQLQLLQGEFKNSDDNFYNLMAHGEYRNRTRNNKWNIGALGKLYLNGYNAGDYHAFVSLQRLLSSKVGSLQLGFENINRSPSFKYDQRSSFYLDAPKSFSKENTVHFFASADQPALRLRIGADYYAITNFLYVTDFYELQQDKTLFTVLRINATKTFRILKNINLYSVVYVQQKTGSAALNIPLFFTRNRLAMEVRPYKNLQLATGFEIRYHTPYKADNYSPVLSQFFYQDATRINNLPDVSAFFNFRIRSFRAYVRAENLNTLNIQNGFQFTNNNFAAPDYPYPGLAIRVSIYWSFVN